MPASGASPTSGESCFRSGPEWLNRRPLLAAAAPPHTDVPPPDYIHRRTGTAQFFLFPSRTLRRHEVRPIPNSSRKIGLASLVADGLGLLQHSLPIVSATLSPTLVLQKRIFRSETTEEKKPLGKRKKGKRRKEGETHKQKKRVQEAQKTK